MSVVTLNEDFLMTIIISSIELLPKGFKITEILPDGRMKAVEILLPAGSSS